MKIGAFLAGSVAVGWGLRSLLPQDPLKLYFAISYLLINEQVVIASCVLLLASSFWFGRMTFAQFGDLNSAVLRVSLEENKEAYCL